MSNGIKASSADLGEHKLICFIVEDVTYGVDIMRVREIVIPVEMARVPATEPGMIGVADYRGKLVPVIDRTYPMDRAAEAHAYVDTERKTGNVILQMAGNPGA